LILAPLATGPFMRASHFVKAQFARVEKMVGVLLVATGVAFLTGGFQSVSLWLIETNSGRWGEIIVIPT
jgi:cytochrome c-type biogenesis protein